MGHYRKDRPVDADLIDEDEDGGRDHDHESDIFELRNCGYCDCFLPLDRAAHVVRFDDEEDGILACDGCFAIHG